MRCDAMRCHEKQSFVFENVGCSWQMVTTFIFIADTRTITFCRVRNVLHHQLTLLYHDIFYRPWHDIYIYIYYRKSHIDAIVFYCKIG